HLPRGSLREGHDQDGGGGNTAGDQAAKALGDDGSLSCARTGDHADRTAADLGRNALVSTQAHGHSVRVERPMRTRIVRTLRPRLRSFSRRTMSSESRPNWWGRGGLEGGPPSV